MTKARGGGREREGESIFKTKDRLGDNEWCKPDDLLANAERSHSLTQPLSPPPPLCLLKLILVDQKMFLLHLIMERKV